MNRLKFKISQAPSIGRSLSLNIQPRKWYLDWLWAKTAIKYVFSKVVKFDHFKYYI